MYSSGDLAVSQGLYLVFQESKIDVMDNTKVNEQFAKRIMRERERESNGIMTHSTSYMSFWSQ